MNIYDIQIEKMNGELVDLKEYKNKTLLIVNIDLINEDI